MARCLFFGTFDVENLGDLLFPHVAAWRLARYEIEIVPVSPTDRKTRFADALPVKAVAEPTSADISGLIIGGGNIVHNRPATDVYDEDALETANWAYASLWVGATMLGAVADVPIVWNAPGVPAAPRTPGEKDMMAAVVDAASYCAVRDQASAANLGKRRKIQVVPDTVSEISGAWPKQDLLDSFEALLHRKGHIRGRFVAIHVKERSLDRPLPELAAAIDTLYAATKLVPILVPIGLCHGDGALAGQLGALVSSPKIVLDDPTSLREMVAVLAWPEAFVGASLHGYVVSRSYGTPALLIARPQLPKFMGFIEQVRSTDDLAGDWAQALSNVGQRTQDPDRRQTLPTTISSRLNQHWEQLAKSLLERASGRSARTRFMRYYWRHGLLKSGLAWGLFPALIDQPPWKSTKGTGSE
jgi:hypothetical protein